MSWIEDYQETLKKLPEPGEILTAIDGPARLIFEITEGKPPFLYGRAFVPEIVGSELGWFLQGEQDHGWKCIILPKSREDCIKRLGAESPILVKSLKVIRTSQTGKSLLCEVHEYL